MPKLLIRHGRCGVKPKPEELLVLKKRLLNMRKWFVLAAITGMVWLLFACSRNPASKNSEAAPATSRSVDYSPRIGIGVRTGVRTCMAIQNGTLAANAPVTLITPSPPQALMEAQIAGQSSSPCPITQDVAPGAESYDISVVDAAKVPKSMPFFVVLGNALSNEIALAGNGVVADLDHNRERETFRACGANDGIYLTVWHDDPLTGKLLWNGHYYEAGNPGALPNCAPAELTPVAPDH